MVCPDCKEDELVWARRGSWRGPRRRWSVRRHCWHVCDPAEVDRRRILKAQEALVRLREDERLGKAKFAASG